VRLFTDARLVVIYVESDEVKLIYWANALFSEADRKFNEDCAKKLRAAGYTVFLPQETSMTYEKAPTNAEIFRVDTTEIQSADILIACIDQFPIDSGVACEIGVAHAFGIPIIGLYTDIRRKREGPGRMYKNQYVMGAIEASGEIVDSMDQLMHVILKYL
jgi:nucleoside 2-deoxyribosyltransferase